MVLLAFLECICFVLSFPLDIKDVEDSTILMESTVGQCLNLLVSGMSPLFRSPMLVDNITRDV